MAVFTTLGKKRRRKQPMRNDGAVKSIVGYCAAMHGVFGSERYQTVPWILTLSQYPNHPNHPIRSSGSSGALEATDFFRTIRWGSSEISAAPFHLKRAGSPPLILLCTRPTLHSSYPPLVQGQPAADCTDFICHRWDEGFCAHLRHPAYAGESCTLAAE